MNGLKKRTQISFRDHNKQLRTGTIKKTFSDGYHVRADRRHIWELEKDLIYYVSKDSIL